MCDRVVCDCAGGPDGGHDVGHDVGHADLAESRCMDRQKQRALNVAGRVNKEIQLPTLTESQSKRLTHGLIDVVTV